MRGAAMIAGSLSLLAMGWAAAAAEPESLRPLAFLLGEWTAVDPGAPGSAVGTAVFRADLQEQVIVRSSFAEYPAADGKPASRHDDLLIVYVGPEGPRADYYDSEGHVIRYGVQSPALGQAVFLSEPAPGEPTFRLTYELAAADTLDGAFEIRLPGSEGFQPYLSWRTTKVVDSAK